MESVLEGATLHLLTRRSFKFPMMEMVASMALSGGDSWDLVKASPAATPNLSFPLTFPGSNISRISSQSIINRSGYRDELKFRWPLEHVRSHLLCVKHVSAFQGFPGSIDRERSLSAVSGWFVPCKSSLEKVDGEISNSG